MFAAVLGEASQVMFRNPFELIKQNMQIGKYNTMKEAILKIYQQNGIKGLYRGYFVTVFREIPFGLIQYPLYEKLKKKKLGNSRYGDTFTYCLCGAQAGGIAAFLTTPIDVVKTRIMTTGKGDNFDISKMIPTFIAIYKNEGAAKLFSGVHVRVAYITIGGMMFFGANEYFKKVFEFGQ
jgi:solute carrier family 25 (mitochondrial S-adenosylmethionine transporter), member 26